MSKQTNKVEIQPLIYTKAQLPIILGLSKTTIDGLRRDKKFPDAVALGGRKVGWPVETIKEWINSRPKASGVY